MHVTSNKNPLQTLSLLPEVRGSSKILRFLVKRFCGLRFKTVRCIVQRSSWSESSPISNMRIFLGQTTVQKGTILSFAISHLPFPLCLNLTGFYCFTTVSRYPAAKFCLWRERENVYAMPSSFAITKYVCSLPFYCLKFIDSCYLPIL